MNKLLRMENVERFYETPAGVVKALDGVDIEIQEGERVILLGPSGSGKSTLIKALLGLIQPNSGKISYYNPIKQLTNIGYVPQHTHLGHWSILENITYPSFKTDSQHSKTPPIITGRRSPTANAFLSRYI